MNQTKPKGGHKMLPKAPSRKIDVAKFEALAKKVRSYYKEEEDRLVSKKEDANNKKLRITFSY